MRSGTQPLSPRFARVPSDASASDGADPSAACERPDERTGSSALSHAADSHAGSQTVIWSHCAINCPGRCPLGFVIENGRPVRIVTDPFAPACVRGRSMLEWIASPHRLRSPLKRTGARGSGEFVEIGWDEALDEIALRLRRIIDVYGNEALYLAYGTGSYATTSRAFKRLLSCLGGFLDYYNNYSNAQITAATSCLFGPRESDRQGSVITQAAHADMIVAFGSSPVETDQGGSGAGRRWPEVCRSVLRRGGRVIVIDPRRNASARIPGVEWIPITPGTDGALACALAHTWLTEGLADVDFLHAHCVGFDEETLPEEARGSRASLVDYLMGNADGVEKTAAWAERICGIDAETITALAFAMAEADTLFVMQGWGLQRRINGEAHSAAVMMLPVMLGQVGLPGTNSGVHEMCEGGLLSKLPCPDNAVAARIPCYLYTAALECGPSLDAADGVRGVPRLSQPIKAIVNYAGNCLTNQHGDINRTHGILIDEKACEFILTMDVELTDSARHSDIVLPDLFRCEQASVMDGGCEKWHAVIGSPVPTDHGIARSAWDVCCELARRLGVEEAFTEGRTEEEWMRELYEQDRRRLADLHLPPFDEARRCGIVHRDLAPRVALSAFRRDPEANPLSTPSGRIELYSTAIDGRRGLLPAFIPERPEADDAERTPSVTRDAATRPGKGKHAREDAPGDRQLRLVGFHCTGRIHSSWGNVASLKARFPQRLLMNPEDAARAGISSGDTVRAFNEHGALIVEAHVTEDIVHGAVALAQGAWHETGTEDDRPDNGASINVLTDLTPSPLAKGNPQNTIFCSVELYRPHR